MGKNMLLTVIDRWTSWPEAYPLSSSGEAASFSVCAEMLIREWIPRFGVSDIITSDRGSQFVSQLWISLCSLVGIKRDLTTAYHSQHNGKLVRWHRTLKNALRARLHSRRTWIQELPWVLLGLRAAPNLDTGVSPSVLVTGKQPALPGQFVLPRKQITDYTSFSQDLCRAMKSQTFSGNPWHGGDKAHNQSTIFDAKSVLVRHEGHIGTLAPKYDGPHEVLEKKEKYFTILRNGVHENISIDRLKTFHESSSTNIKVNESLEILSEKRQSKPPDRLTYYK